MVTKINMPRTYTMRARAEGVAAREQRVLDAAYSLFVSGDLDAVTLEAVAARAGVSLKTVVRQFVSKDEMLLACARAGSAREESLRVAAPGDLDGIVATLGRRYEAMLDLVPRMNALVERLEAAALAQKNAIASHLGWLGAAFAPWLPAAGAVRKQRLMALYGATELYVWWMWRRNLGLTRAGAAAAMRETLDALVTRWAPQKERD